MHKCMAARLDTPHVQPNWKRASDTCGCTCDALTNPDIKQSENLGNSELAGINHTLQSTIGYNAVAITSEQANTGDPLGLHL